MLRCTCTLLVTLAVLPVLSTACSPTSSANIRGNSADTDGDGESGETFQDATDTGRIPSDVSTDETESVTGSLRIQLSTRGKNKDQNGYKITVGESGAKQISPNGTTRFADLEAGEHRVSLAGMRANCTTTQSNPRIVEIVSDQTKSIEFRVNCYPYLLEVHPDAYLAYSLRKLRSDYTGPVLRVSRTSDGSKRDFGFTDGGRLEVEGIEKWLSGADGAVVKWYSQLEGQTDLTSDSDNAPLIARKGKVITTQEGEPMLYFPSGATLSADLDKSFPQDDSSIIFTVDLDEHLQSYSQRRLLWFGQTGVKHPSGRRLAPGPYGDLWNDGGIVGLSDTFIAGYSNAKQQRWVYVNSGEAAHITEGTNDSISLARLRLGDAAAEPAQQFEGHIGAILVYPSLDREQYLERYDNLNAYWKAGPNNYNPEALLPQTFNYQVTLYDWLETIEIGDVRIPTGKEFNYEAEILSRDELADLWLQTAGLSASSVVRGEPEWWVLNTENGKGIEATGDIRLWYEPEGTGGHGNPPRSWENEPAYLYQLDLPLFGRGQGNPYHEMPELGRRAMISAIVDLMMHQSMLKDGSSGWFDMVGKSFLGMAESYRWSGEVLPSRAKDAFEKGMEYILDHQIAQGPRGANTNMDIFMLHGAADFYMATDDPELEQKCVEVVKKALFGYADGSLETKHRVFANGGGENANGGVFSSAGFIMEGDQPDIFYGGESMLHLMGAYTAVMDRKDGSVPPDWQFLEEVLRRTQQWRTYQMFHNPEPDYFARGSGAGFASRTSVPVPSGQAGFPWKRVAWADLFDSGKIKLRNEWKGDPSLPTPSNLKKDISNNLDQITSKMSSLYKGKPDTWSGWSPWTKPTPYLPPEGWYSRLRSLLSNDDPLTYPPSARNGVTFNKTFGGPPLGKSWWAYKQQDKSATEWGFFAEAMPSQGNYGGYFGGKLETFWTDDVGYVLVNRHEKGGNPGWDELESWAAHHVWGKDENGDRFTTAWLRGWDLDRSVTFNTDSSPPSISVNNPFNDPEADKQGEQNTSVLEGDVDIENNIVAVENGAKLTHTITSDQSDQITKLWASLPFFITEDNAEQDVQKASLDYWDGTGWKDMPEDQNNDGIPEFVNTTALRFTRPVGDSKNHAYVDFSVSETIRLSTQRFLDSYQTGAWIRAVHIDLHGNPGSVRSMPAQTSVSYTLQTTSPE